MIQDPGRPGSGEEAQAKEPQVTRISEDSLGNDGTGEGLGQDFGVMTVEELEAFMTREAYTNLEQEALDLLEQKNFHHETCQKLILQLPLQPVARHRKLLGAEHATYLTFGAYAHGALGFGGSVQDFTGH